MAQQDWRRYFVPVYEQPSGLGNGTSAHIAGDVCFFTRQDALERGRYKGKVVALLAVKGKSIKVQRELWKRAY